MFERLLIANRGEIAVRIARAAAELDIATVAVCSEDDAASPHLRVMDQVVTLDGSGPAAYLNVAAVVRAARESDCDALHPGYGFLSERAELAAACGEAAITFVGPSPAVLERFGDKLAARDLAASAGVACIEGAAVEDDEQAAAFFAALAGAPMMVKAVAGGGGRGMRVVRSAGEITAALARCRSEAQAAFGRGELYVEAWWERPRHVEVQLLGDRHGGLVHLGDRDCSLQRRHQKLVEIAPAPHLPAAVRERLWADALVIGRAAELDNLATIEFLVGPDGRHAFIEANARLQVEHTITEAVYGVDVVQAQLRLAAGETVLAVGCDGAAVAPRGVAIQCRVNLEPPTTAGAEPVAFAVFEPPSGAGVRVDTFVTTDHAPSLRYDPLLAKVITHASGGTFAAAVRKAASAVGEFRVEGVDTNLAFLRQLLALDEVRAGDVHTQLVEQHAGELQAAIDAAPPPEPSAATSLRVGATIDPVDPLAVLELGRSTPSPSASAVPGGAAIAALELGDVAVPAPLQGTVVSVDVRAGDPVAAGQPLVVIEAMKMEHVVAAPASGVVRRVDAVVGATIAAATIVVVIDATATGAEAPAASREVDLDRVRADLAEVISRHEVGLDHARTDAVARRRRTGQRTARENIDDLVDPGSFVEYGPLAVAAQRRRRPLAELIERTPADGMVAGVATVNAELFGERARCVVASYDYTVLAGTQGLQNHRKKDRMFELAARQRLPLVLFAEGGGGRPGDTDGLGVSGLDCLAFALFAELSGLVPVVGIVSGRCFAGNAALAGCCDVIIATEGTNLGMGGPAMIEGGGLGVFRPEEVGPLAVQTANGVVDVAVADEAEAVAVARRYLSYFQGRVPDWSCTDQRLLRELVPENRLRVYDVRSVIGALADTGSVLELRQGFGAGMVTALVRVEGRPLGIVANNPTHLAGAIDADAADKASRFLQLCDAHDVPVLFLCDTPGIMVGPDAEQTALVRHASRLFVTGASLTVPFFTVVLRKGYGLGAQAMAGGSFKAPLFTVAWPTAEFGGMGLEGAVKLGYRNELAAIDDPVARRALFDEMVARMYEHGKGINAASHFEIDDVIDPADTRRWITAALDAAPPPPPRTTKKRPCIDTW